MKVFRHQYSEALSRSAESFLIEQFGSPTQFTEASHLPDLVDAAMHIVTGAAWVQSDGVRRGTYDTAVDEGRYDEEDDEDEES